MALKLVQVGLSGAAMFGPDGQVLQPSEVLRKKAILVERGSFRPPTVVNIDMLESARTKFETDPAVADREVLVLTELTMANLLAEGDRVDRRDFLARADLLAACGMTVLISDYVAFHRLAAYIAWRTDGRIGMVMGIPSLIDQFDEANHADLPGGILESFGRLFKNDLRLFVYPMLRDGQVTTVHNLAVGESCSRCTTTSSVGAASSTWTTTSRTTYPSSAATSCDASPAATRCGSPWCRRRSGSSSRNAASSVTTGPTKP